MLQCQMEGGPGGLGDLEENTYTCEQVQWIEKQK